MASGESSNGINPEINLEVQKSYDLRAPSMGMSFRSIEEAHNYYEDYGRLNGLWIRKRGTNEGKNRSKEVTSVLFVCAREGKYTPKNNDEVLNEYGNKGVGVKINKRARTTSSIKCGCLARMRINLDKWSSKWNVTVFYDKHNHGFVTPCKRQKMKSNRHMPKAIKNLTKEFHDQNMEISKIVPLFGGEYIGFNNRDCYNYLRDVRFKNLDCGDAHSILMYFKNQQAQNPQFYYAIHCDEHERAVNFFWVDARSRMAYQYFEDVVSFDTTYRTNKYNMPFAPFTGVNHHMQSIQFGTMNDLYKKISEIRLHEKMGENSSENLDAKSCEKTGEKSETEPSQLLLLDPNISQTKGRKKDNSKHSERFKGGLEAALSKKKRHCKCCNKFVYHDTRTCPENPRSKFYKGAQMVEGDLKSGQEEEESEHEEENGQEEESEQETDYSEDNN